MSRRTSLSAQALAVLAALAARPADWRHGYDLARETGLKSGTLYPVLVRLAAATAALAAPAPAVRAARPERAAARRRLAPEGP